ncbi:hypothetical protein Tco_0386134 [Tanacetum coccineum]
MTTTRQGMSSAEIDQIVAHASYDAIEVIAIYETKIRITHDPVNRILDYANGALIINMDNGIHEVETIVQ